MRKAAFAAAAASFAATFSCLAASFSSRAASAAAAFAAAFAAALSCLALSCLAAFQCVQFTGITSPDNQTRSWLTSQNNQKVVLTGIQYHFGPGAETPA
jgi:hypothetical protein